MKKILIMASIVLTLSLSTSLSFAEAIQTRTINSEGVNKTDPLYISLKTQYENLKVLREQQSLLEDTIRSQTKQNGESAQRARDSIKSEIVAAKSKNHTELTAVKNALLSLQTQKKDLQAKIAFARQNKETTGLEALKKTMADLNTSATTKQAELVALREKYKLDKTTITSILATAKEAHLKIQALRTEMANTTTEIRKLQATKHQEWENFSKAMLSKDLTLANTSMGNIVKLKQQIIDKLNAILILKKQINTILIGL